MTYVRSLLAGIVSTALYVACFLAFRPATDSNPLVWPWLLAAAVSGGLHGGGSDWLLCLALVFFFASTTHFCTWMWKRFRRERMARALH